MQYNLEKTSHYSLASITQEDSLIVSAVIAVDVHSQQSAVNQAMSHMYPDVLLSGAGKFSRPEFLNAVNMLGASIDIGMSGGMMSVSLRSTADNFGKLLKLVEVMFSDPHISAKELVRISGTAINNLEHSRENSAEIAYENLLNNIYIKTDRHYTYSIDSVISEVKLITTGLLKDLHKTILNQLWIISIAGDEKANKLFEQSVKRIKKTQQSPLMIESDHGQNPILKKMKTALVEIPSKQNIDFSIGVPIPFTFLHPDYMPLVFAVAVLGKWGGFTGRLMSTVREKEGLTYGIYAGLSGFHNEEQGNMRIKTFFAPDKTIQGITSTLREVKKIYKKGITEEEFVKFKTILITGQTLVNDSIVSLFGELHTYHLRGFSLEEIKVHKNKLNLLTITDVNRVIKEYMNPDSLIISGAGPIKNVKNEIEKIVKSGV